MYEDARNKDYNVVLVTGIDTDNHILFICVSVCLSNETYNGHTYVELFCPTGPMCEIQVSRFYREKYQLYLFCTKTVHRSR